MSETQKTIHQWIDATFPGTDPDSPRKSLRLIEECVELCLASGASVRDIFGAIENQTGIRVDRTTRAGWAPRSSLDSRRKPDEIPAEAADVLIVLYGVAGMRGFDLHAEVDRKMARNRARKWEARGDGTGYHVKGSDPDDGSVKT